MTIAENRLHADPGIEAHELHPQRSAILETAQQRDRAVTIYEKSKPGRRAFVAPELDVPEGTSCRSGSAAPSRRSCRRSPSRRSSATTTGCPSATSTWTPASTRSGRAR